MNARLIPLSLICLLLWSMPVQALPRAGERMPDLAVNGTLSAEAAEYLGLPVGTVGFRLSEVRAEFLLVEIFSMYCPHCQHEAPRLNELFRRLPDSPLAGRLKVLGVGVGNSDFEVDFFRKEFQVPFPMFPDADSKAYEAVGRVGTPTFVLLRPGSLDARGLSVLFSQEGTFESPEEFLGRLVRAAKAR